MPPTMLTVLPTPGHALSGRLSEGSSPDFQKWLLLPLPLWRIPNAFGDLFDKFLAALGIP